MKRILMLAAMASVCCRAQPDRDCQPAPSNAGGAQTLQITLSHLDQFSWIGCFSAPIRGFDAKTAYNGVFADAAAFNRKVRLLRIGAGTAETAMHEGAQAMHEALDQAGIRNVFYE